ncbi:MAG: hypothetical protein JW795_22000 [Chitinivibrionales bacterium]|nr:hypothetical protein [Chitinivibrionales bacterium]
MKRYSFVLVVVFVAWCVSYGTWENRTKSLAAATIVAHGEERDSLTVVRFIPKQPLECRAEKSVSVLWVIYAQDHGSVTVTQDGTTILSENIRKGKNTCKFFVTSQPYSISTSVHATGMLYHWIDQKKVSIVAVGGGIPISLKARGEEFTYYLVANDSVVAMRVTGPTTAFVHLRALIPDTAGRITASYSITEKKTVLLKDAVRLKRSSAVLSSDTVNLRPSVPEIITILVPAGLHEYAIHVISPAGSIVKWYVTTVHKFEPLNPVQAMSSAFLHTLEGNESGKSKVLVQDNRTPNIDDEENEIVFQDIPAHGEIPPHSEANSTVGSNADAVTGIPSLAKGKKGTKEVGMGQDSFTQNIPIHTNRVQTILRQQRRVSRRKSTPSDSITTLSDLAFTEWELSDTTMNDGSRIDSTVAFKRQRTGGDAAQMQENPAIPSISTKENNRFRSNRRRNPEVTLSATIGSGYNSNIYTLSQSQMDQSLFDQETQASIKSFSDVTVPLHGKVSVKNGRCELSGGVEAQLFARNSLMNSVALSTQAGYFSWWNSGIGFSYAPRRVIRPTYDTTITVDNKKIRRYAPLQYGQVRGEFFIGLRKKWNPVIEFFSGSDDYAPPFDEFDDRFFDLSIRFDPFRLKTPVYSLTTQTKIKAGFVETAAQPGQSDASSRTVSFWATATLHFGDVSVGSRFLLSDRFYTTTGTEDAHNSRSDIVYSVSPSMKVRRSQVLYSLTIQSEMRQVIAPNLEKPLDKEYSQTEVQVSVAYSLRLKDTP